MDHDSHQARGADRVRLWLRRALWLVALWLLGVLVVGTLAYGLRLVMGWVGLRL